MYLDKPKITQLSLFPADEVAFLPQPCIKKISKRPSPSKKPWVTDVKTNVKKDALETGLLERLDLSNLSAFQQDVLKKVLSIPLGQTMTFGYIARAIGRPGAAGMVARFLKKNPFPLLIPCHRVTHKPRGKTPRLNPTKHTATQRIKESLLEMEMEYVNPMFPIFEGLPSSLPTLLNYTENVG